jgi:predicted patatin/cPLA2 family phospholipase
MTKPIIQHLVLSGGGEIGICFYGALRDAHHEHFWHIDNIRTMFSTSAGSLFSTVTALTKFVSWELLDNFMKRRPWDQVFDINFDTIMNAFANGGILGPRTVVDFMSPVLRAADLDVYCTLTQFYEKTGIEIHYMCTNMDAFCLVDISYRTHPDWRVVDAVYASCALPGLFRPIIVEGTMYADGAIFCNFPVDQCIARIKEDSPTLSTEEMDKMVLCLRRICEEEASPMVTTNPVVNRQVNLVEYISSILLKLLYNVSMDRNINYLPKYTIDFEMNYTSIYEIYRVCEDSEYMINMCNRGCDKWKLCRDKWNQEQEEDKNTCAETDNDGITEEDDEIGKDPKV